MERNFISRYLDYTEHTEPPYIYHRWAAITCAGALLGRNVWLDFGHWKFYPNIYCMLIGEPAARKSTAIKLNRRLVAESGYGNFSADKTKKEKFLIDLAGLDDDEIGSTMGTSDRVELDNVTAGNLWGEFPKDPREVFVVADEWNEFAGVGDTEFFTLLGNLWDWDDETRPYSHRLKNSKSVQVWQPTVSILGGNTPELFARCFPPEAIGGGFLSRMLLIHGEKSGRKFTIPPKPEEMAKAKILSEMQAIRNQSKGAAKLDEAAFSVLDKIYHSWIDIDDIRFKAYSNRRFTQLCKLCLVISNTTREDGRITDAVVITANTFLSAAEFLMPKALGEFGKSKNSDVANKIMSLLQTAAKPLATKDLWKAVARDLDKPIQLSEIIDNLAKADKIQHVKDVGGGGWLPKLAPPKKLEFVDWGLLTEEERIDR